jgi:hypothetical protein
MKLLAAALLMLAGCGCVSVPAIAPVASVAMKIEMPLGSCSATAVSAHWILTAAHCVVQGGPVVAVAGAPTKTPDLIFDGSDHVLVRVDHTFQRWAGIRGALIGDRVRMLGNPEIFTNIYRTGYVAGINTFPDCPPVPGLLRKHCTAILFQMVTGSGDSGAGYFDDAGELVAVHTGTIRIGMAGLAYALPLAFTKQQLGAIG